MNSLHPCNLATGQRRHTLLYASVSTLAMLIAAPAGAQQVINNGDNATVTSALDGETISAGSGVSSTVNAAPVVVVANNMVTLENQGTLSTTGVTQTVQVNQGTSGTTINNSGTGQLVGESRVINVDGTNVVINNDSAIFGTGTQRNGAIYGNRTSNNIEINNTSTGSINAGVEGAAIAIEVGGGGMPRSGSITNAGAILGRGQAAATGGTAGDGLRFFGPGIAPAYIYAGDITNSGLIASESLQGTVAAIRFTDRIGFQGTLANTGAIIGAQNGVYFGDADHTGGVVNNSGLISSASRALNIDGRGLVVHNSGAIQGTGNQRNGTVYSDGTADDFTLNNQGLIDAGMGNQGSGFAAEVGQAADGATTFTLSNSGAIQGRGAGDPVTGLAGDGVRIGNAGNIGIFDGAITNSGLINSESSIGTTAGLRVVDGVAFQGTLRNDGTISGVQNGVYFGNADHTGGVVDNFGTISSGSRAFNIDGTGLEINNSGTIRGTGNQRNGTVYSDSTAQDFTLNNAGLIDAGEGNQGAGFSAELSADGNDFAITNSGTIQGRGQADAGSALAGDGLRFERERVMGMLDGSTTGLFTGTITNSGLINSEAVAGTTAGIRFVNGISFRGEINNSGTISGVNNGLYFGNPVPAGGADHTGGVVNNSGVISSNSRALNIDGTGLAITNLAAGRIIGTGNQRNGTVYSDGTADDFTLNNQGLIDAGGGNLGSGFAAEVGEAADGATTFTLTNSGTIQGRGAGDPVTGLAGDGVRIGNAGNIGVFDGSITNSGLINSESTAGTTAGLRVVDGVAFQGTLTNNGTISGAQNGVYFGNADHTGGVVNNSGVISSNSRALNIDGTGLAITNLAAGRIIGTGNQRNGTVYADSTAQNFTLGNAGLIDAGMGNEGAGFSVELASAAAGGNTFTITNSGTIQGRGNAGAGLATAGDGLRFERERVAGMLDGTTDGLFIGGITNSGTIASEGDNGTVAGIRFVNGVSYRGTLTNTGTISGVENGLYFGNPVPAGGGDFTQAIVNNSGTISSGSRAVNIDGTGLTLNNLAAGRIIGTGNQRNGTVYADGTANGFTITNAGLIDAGMGNAGSGVSLQLGAVVDDMRNFTLTNSGTITGRGAALPSGANAGVRLFSNVAGVSVAGTITNSGTISSTNAAGLLIENVAFNGTVTNSSTITGVVNAVDASTATAALRFVQNGGALNGNFVGSAFADTLTFGTGPFALNSNILNGVAVTTNAGSVITVNGPRSINGSLTVNGTLNFDLGTDEIAVTGNTVLGSGSRINIATDLITAADIGRTIDVLTDTGSFTNNGALINVADNDFLIDYEVVFGSLAVAVRAADFGDVSADANINSFGSAITSAVANNRLQANVFNAFNNAGSAAQFEAIALSLLPAVNDGVTREIYETQRFASSLVQDRLRGEGTGLWGEAFARNAHAEATSLSSLAYDADATGITFGLDTRLAETTKIGVLFNYSGIGVDANETSSATSEINAVQIGAYAGFDLGKAYANAELGYSTSTVDNRRTGLLSPIVGESDVDGLYGSVNVGYELDAGGLAITPSVGLRYAELSRSTFTERGGLDLTLDSDSAEFLEARIGVRVAASATSGFVPFASVDYAYDLGSAPLAVRGSFNGGADSFVVVADEASASRFDVAAGIDFVNEGGLSIGAEYRGRFTPDYQSNAGGIRVRIAF